MEQEAKRKLFEDKTSNEVVADILWILGAGVGLAALGYLVSLLGIEGDEKIIMQASKKHGFSD